MIDDPYRSLAGLARTEGAYTKGPEDYFIEFVWANFYRTRIKIKKGKDGFVKALKKAVKLSHSPEASGQPGYTPDGKCVSNVKKIKV